MGNQLIIERIEVHQYQWEVSDLAADDYYNGFNTVYSPGTKSTATGRILKIITDQGITGEFVGGSKGDYVQMEMFLHYLIGKSALQRELIYNDVKRALRKYEETYI